MAKIETLVNDFKINYLTEEEYQNALTNNKINENEVYMTPEGNIRKVTQNAAITTDSNYPIMLASEAATTNTTDVLNKTDSLKYNPSTQALSTGKLIVALNYGTTLPSSGTEGEIFLLLVE